ncbi:MAG: glycoside hydrolase family 43 protein [Lachnospiraceae bacterium]|nr:glycoside hydrolase family 43 protein [Lachnospiraceae bacterium]
MAIALTVCGCASPSGDTGKDAAASTEISETDNVAENTGNETAESNEAESDTLDFTVDLKSFATGAITAGASVHDPSIYQDGDTYYIFGSHMTAAKTTDLLKWQSVGDGYRNSNPVYGKLFESSDVFRYAGKGNSVVPTDDGGCHLWAPDVIYNEAMGCYTLYYCASSTWNTSTIGFATSDTLEGPYEWAGDLLYSGITKDTIAETDVLDYVSEDYAKSHYMRADGSYNFDKYPNALDPSVFYDEDGRLWMVYGSWSGGMFLIELDPATGQVIHPEADEENHVDPYFGKWLLGGYHHSIEGPYILYDKEAGYYYLFVSYGGLARTGGYQIRCYRSETVDGNYIDMNGKGNTCETNTDHWPYGLKLSGNYMLPSLKAAYMATGHNSAFIDENNGNHYLVYHTRFDSGNEMHFPRVKQFCLNKEAWPCALPYEEIGEAVTDGKYDTAAVTGKYYMINQGLTISDAIAKPEIMYLLEDGSAVLEDKTGTWTLEEGTNYMTLTLDDKTYSGVFAEQKDLAGTDVFVFTAVGANESVWGVRYTE